MMTHPWLKSSDFTFHHLMKKGEPRVISLYLLYLVGKHFIGGYNMPKCAAVFCSNKNSKGCGQTFHRFPLNFPDRVKLWVLKMGRDCWYPDRYSVICSDHFTEDCFDRTGQIVRLRDHAVPTIFPEFPKTQKNINLYRKIPVQQSHSLESQLLPASGKSSALTKSSLVEVSNIPNLIQQKRKCFELGRQKLNTRKKLKGLSALVSSKTSESELSQSIGDYDYQLEGIFGHGPQRKQAKEVSASDFVSSLLTRKNDLEPGSASTCGAEVEKGASNIGENSNGNLVHFEETFFEPCSLDGERKLEPTESNMTQTITPSVRNKRKQSVKPRIELSFVEAGDECAGTGEVGSSEKNAKPRQITLSNENRTNRSIGDKPPRERLKTISVTEYVCGLPLGNEVEPGILRICGADLIKEAAKNGSENSNGNLKEVLNLGNGKRKRPVKRRKRNKLMKNCDVDGSECGNLPGQEISFEEAEFSAITAPDVEDMNFKCFVCSQVIASRFAILLSLSSEASNIPLRQHVEEIAGLEGHVGSHEVVCRRCSSLLNHIDKVEAELKILKGAISTCTKRKDVELHVQNDPNILRSMKVLDRFSTVVDGKYNVLSLEELFLIKTEKEVVDGEGTFSHPDKEVIDCMPSQGETKELVAEIYLEGLEGHVSESDKGMGPNKTQESHEETISSEGCGGFSNGAVHIDKCDSPGISEQEKKVEEGPSVELANGVECIPEAEMVNDNAVNDVKGDQNVECDPKTRVCKICSFKTVHESVMIWHLRMHMKSHRWCDFCTAAVLEEESIFTLLKKTRPPYKPHKRRANPKPPFILPAVPVDPVTLSSVPLSSFPLSVIPLRGATSQNPVVLISREAKGMEEGVIVTKSIGNHYNSDEITVESNEDREVLIYSENLVISKTSTLTKDLSTPKNLMAIPSSEESESQAKFVPGVGLSAVVQEDENLETYSGLYASATEQLGKSDNLASVGAEYDACLSNCSNSDETTAINSFSNLPEPSSIVSSECDRTNNEFMNEGSQCLKAGSIHSEETYEEVATETSFLESLSSQPEEKYSEILPEIVGEAAIQNTLSASNSVAEEGITNKDVSFARSGSLGVSDLAMAYESSVAALMCQSDDSEGMISYN